MKRLVLFFWMILGASAFGINITNYPSTNAFDSSLWFLLSKPSAPTNFNLPGNYVASTSDLNGASNSIIAQFPTTNGFASTSDLNGSSNAIIAQFPTTNGFVTGAGMAYLASNNVFTSSNVFQGSLVVTGAQYLALSNGTARVLMTNGTITSSSTATVGALASSGSVGGSYFSVNNAGWPLFWNGIGSKFISVTDGDYTFGNNSLSAAPMPAAQKANWPTVTPVSPSNSMMGLSLNGMFYATNGVALILKASFTTNFTCTTNLQTYLCNGTNQIVTLPNAAYVPNVIYRFTSTNGYGSYIVTNATGAQTVRDGASLSHKQVGIAPFSVFSDGAQWWLAAKDQSVQPNAQFSCSTNIPLTSANTAYPVTFNSTDFNNSQGIALALGTNGTHFSKMWITNSGQYEFTPSIVIGMGNVSHTVRYWFRSNDTNIPASTTPTKVGGNDVIVVTVPFVVNITTPTAIEIWAESDGVNDSLAAGSASGNYPASPSVICPVKRISDTWP